MNTKTHFDPFDLRQALGSFATGVTIVTTLSATQARVGVTANSFSSVSLEPAIVLWSLRKNSPSLGSFDHSGRFVINVLSSAQADLSTRFASPVEDKFNFVPTSLGIEGLPIIKDCAAVFECKAYQRIEVGDHILYLGEVQAYSYKNIPTLMYHRGKYLFSESLEQKHTLV